MELTLIEKERRTRIKVSRAQYPKYASIIDGYMLLYGGRKERESSRYVYFIIDAEVMARGLK